MPEFFARLRFQRRMLIVLSAIALVFSVIGSFSLVILLTSAVNVIAPIQESVAVQVVNITLLLAVAGFIAAAILLKRRQPSEVEVAQLIEQRHPELKQSLSTAVEIYQHQGAPDGELQAALFRSVEAQTETLDFRKAGRPRMLHPGYVMIIVIAALALSDFAGRSSVALKAGHARMDQSRGEFTGMTVEPGAVEVPRGSDLEIRVEVHRWKNDSHLVTDINGRRERFPMKRLPDGTATFTLYGIEAPLQYWVETSSLTSPVYAVAVYAPPRVESARIETEPPAYTGESPGSYARLLDLVQPEGTRVGFELDLANASHAELRYLDGSVSLEKGADGQWRAELLTSESGHYQIMLRDDEGRVAVTGLYDLEVIPDAPPVVEITDPGRDTFARPEGVEPLSLFAGDDYGLTRVELHYSLSGLPRAPVVVFESEGSPPLEREMTSAVELARLSAEHGDVVTYYVVAWDNRTPEPQSARSSVFFIEVLQDIPEQEEDASETQEGGEGPPDEINLRAVAVELKRLIRETFKVEPLSGAEREGAMQKLGSDINAVKNEAVSILSKVGGMLMEVEGGVIFEMFRNGLVRMDDAEHAVNADDPVEARPALQEALSNIIFVESYLRTLPEMEQQQSGTSGQGQPSQGQAQDDPESGAESGQENNMSPAQMQAHLEALRQIIDEQTERNADYREADGQMLGQTELGELAAAQAEVRNDLSLAIENLRHLNDTYGIREALKQARSEMGVAQDSAVAGEIGRAGRYGERASNTLSEVAEALDERIREAIAQAVDDLVAQAGQMAGQQESAAQASKQAADGQQPGNPGAMRAQQDALKEQLAQLQAEISRQAVEMEGIYPEVAGALANAYQGTARANTAGEMQRALNAMLYDRYKRVERHQQNAAQQLNELQASLQQARGQLPGLSATALERLIGQVQQARQSALQGDPAQAQAQMRSTARQLGGAGEALADFELVELGQNLEAAQEGEGSGLTPRQMIPALDQAQAILRDYLIREQVESRLRLNREGAPPPEKYRQLVEDYFRNLAEE